MPADKEKDDSEVKSSKPKKSLPIMKIVVIAVVLVVLGVGGFIAYEFLMKAPSAQNAEQQGGEQPQEQIEMAPQKPTAQEPGIMVDLSSYVVNLSDQSGQSRYLKISLSGDVATASKKLPDEIATKMPMIKDIIITVLSSKTFDEVVTPQGKISLKSELLRRINSVLTGGKIREIYLTDFVVQ